MRIYELKAMQGCEITKPSIVALGDFDGCHVGHRAVFSESVRLAKSINAVTVAYIFEKGKSAQRSIHTLEEKIRAVRQMGIDYIAIDDFDRVKNMSGDEFVKTVLIGELNAKGATCGYNYRFGKGALCSAEDLKSFFENLSGSVRICGKIEQNGVPVSSTLLREYIENGRVEELLEISAPYSILSEVISGKGLGRKMGVATINQLIPEFKVVPKRGVYITDCQVGEDVYPCVTNIGLRPTVDDEKTATVNMETHIIGYEGNLYLSYVRVNFYKYIREEMKFPSIEALISQIQRDIEASVEYLSYK